MNELNFDQLMSLKREDRVDYLLTKKEIEDKTEWIDFGMWDMFKHIFPWLILVFLFLVHMKIPIANLWVVILCMKAVIFVALLFTILQLVINAFEMMKRSKAMRNLKNKYVKEEIINLGRRK